MFVNAHKIAKTFVLVTPRFCKTSPSNLLKVPGYLVTLHRVATLLEMH